LPQGGYWRNLSPIQDAMTGKDQQKDSRKRRLSAALRDNLKRRRAQAKERAAGSAAAEPGRAGTHDSAGIGDDKQQR
jgi:predicted transcriptional regulator